MSSPPNGNPPDSSNDPTIRVPSRTGESYVPFPGDNFVEGQAPTSVPGSSAGEAPTIMTNQAGGEAPTVLGPASGAPRPTGSNAPIQSPKFQSGAPSPAGPVEATMPIGVDAEVTAPAPSRAASAAKPAASSTSNFATARPDQVDLTGLTLDGYTITKKLGAGGMGAVCLARQNSLDRDVALKILPGQFATNPDYLARFTREALSAAQLSHHNVIQVYDVGCDKNIHYIAMEFVRGKSLGDLTRTEGKLSIEDAASFVLQTARGLLYAHEHGIIHRDIKPDNIMVNEHGIVKIADLGLAKMNNTTESGVGLDHGAAEALKQQAYSDLTGVAMAMGTPAYMAPEQGRDASKVDHRADQYSLGCTLYYLVAGKTPFSGKTTFEIISKHASEPLVPIETIVKNVPKELSYIIEKMLAKNPEERFASLREVIQALEAYLGVESSKGPYTPREQHVNVLETQLKAYYGTPALKLRTLTRIGFFAGFGLLFLLLAVLKQAFLASAVLGLLVLTPLFVFLLEGILMKTFLFRRVRSVFFGMTLKNWALTLLGGAAILITLYFFNLLLPWITVSVFAAGLAVAYEFGVLARLRQARKPALDETNEMLKQLRIRGVSEEHLQDFVYRFSDVHWEEFFEDLFGYEDMILARGKFAKQDKVKPRKKFATWRDPIFRWLDEIEESRRREREKKQLTRAEKERLKAKGMDEAAAAKEADKIAQSAIDDGLLKTAILPGNVPSRKEIERIDRELHRSGKKSRGGGWVGRGFRLVRFAVGAVALGGFALPLLARQGIPIPGIIQGLYINYYYPLGFGAPYALWAAIGGLLLMLTCLSQRAIAPLLLLVGTIMLAACQALASLNPAATAQMVYLAGAGFVAAGFLATFWGLIFRKR